MHFMKGKHWLIGVIIILAAYGIYSGRNELLDAKKEQAGWAAGDLDILVSKCIEDSREMATSYPQQTKDYCECSMQRIQDKFSKAEYLEISRKTVEEQTRLLLPVFQNCLSEYQSRIKK